MTTFDERERAFENLFAHDEELRFKALARRNKAVARWAASQMGRTGPAVAAYETAILTFALDHADEGALADRLVADLSGSGLHIPAETVRAEMTRRLAEAVADEKTA